MDTLERGRQGKTVEIPNQNGAAVQWWFSLGGKEIRRWILCTACNHSPRPLRQKGKQRVCTQGNNNKMWSQPENPRAGARRSVPDGASTNTASTEGSAVVSPEGLFHGRPGWRLLFSFLFPSFLPSFSILFLLLPLLLFFFTPKIASSLDKKTFGPGIKVLPPKYS